MTRRIFYGWFIVAAALVAQFTAACIQSNSQAVFLKPMSEDLGWSRADFTWGQTVGTLIMSGAGFFIGNLLDAKGPRPFMLAGSVVMAASVASPSSAPNMASDMSLWASHMSPCWPLYRSAHSGAITRATLHSTIS